ncbi:DUF6691 family protein [Rhodoblastus sp.]|uniref:DUF6691 family protein n=1 Tax=Rhodoblastus sp. TaxID=1962975 RepID=UPI003F9A38A9
MAPISDAPSPTATNIDARLLGGAALFGAGWGLVGVCPGSALADLGWLNLRAILLILAMADGILLT